MKFKIIGIKGTKLIEIKKFLDIFIKEAEKEYKRQIQSSKLAKIQRMTPFPIKLPEEMTMAYYDNNNSIILTVIAGAMPIKWFKKRVQKKMSKNLEGYLKDQNLNVKIEILGD